MDEVVKVCGVMKVIVYYYYLIKVDLFIVIMIEMMVCICENMF